MFKKVELIKYGRETKKKQAARDQFKMFSSKIERDVRKCKVTITIVILTYVQVQISN